MRRGCLVYILLFLLCLLLVMGIWVWKHKVTSSSPGVQDDSIISPEDRNSDLYKEIQWRSGEYKIEAIDARVDEIWKAIPGYNGREVDIDDSYMEMRSGGEFDNNKIVFRELVPRIHLEDLPPQPIYRGNPEKPMVAFLINVAWGNEYIPGILATLAAHQLESTFFFDGSWTEDNPELAKNIYEAGHEIGNHAYSHPDLGFCSPKETLEEINKTNMIIEETLGLKPVLFAPPSGSFSEVTVETADGLGMKTILWTVDTIDWQKPLAEEMVNRVVSQVENGSMILMHPTRPTAQGLDAMISGIREKGYQLGTVSDLLDEKRIDPWQGS
jgi:probable sporulation protein (polysaccharide deacetylase family)